MIARIANWSVAGAIREILGLTAKVKQPNQASEGAKTIWGAGDFAESKIAGRRRQQYDEWLVWVKRQTGNE